MNRQRGFVMPGFLAGTVAKLVLVLLILGAIAGIIHTVKSYIEDRDAAIFAAGESKERAKWQARESAELAQANKTILFLNDAYRKKEAANAADLNKISVQHQEDLKNAKAQRDRDVAAAHAGTLVLRIPGSATPACEAGSGGAPAEAGAGTGGRDAAPGIELPRQITADLFALADDADEVTKQLGRCQDIVEADRR